MKRIAVISMILFVSCDSTDSHEVDRIVIYTEPVTIAETAGIDYIINLNTGKFHYSDCPSVNQMAEHNKKSILVTVMISSCRDTSHANAVTHNIIYYFSGRCQL